MNMNTFQTIPCLSKSSNARAHGVKANRQLKALHSVIDQLLLDFESEQSILIAGQSQEEENSKHPGERQFYDPLDMELRKKWARTLSSDTRKTVEENLKVAENLGPIRKVATAPSPKAFDQLLVDYPNFSEAIQLIQRRLTLCRCAPEQLIKLPPILLSGPPGVGKTAFCRCVAKILGVVFTEIDVATMTASFSVTGLDAGYTSCRPGLIWDTLNKGDGNMSGLILLDEIDKNSRSNGESYLGFMYGLLEHSSAQRFQDGALLLPVDASHLIWIATCNDTAGVDSAILSRFEVINVSQPSDVQMHAVVKSIHRDLFATSEWACAFDSNIPSTIIQTLSSQSPRHIRRALEAAYANSAQCGRRTLTVDDLKPQGSPSQDTSQRRSIGFINTNQ
jgi:ATP-dependent Lon protease